MYTGELKIQLQYQVRGEEVKQGQKEIEEPGRAQGVEGRRGEKHD